MPAAAFVVAGLVGTDEAFWWDEVATLADRGFAPPSMAVATPQEVVRALKLIPDGERRAAIAELRARAGGRVPDPRRQLTVADVQALAAGGIAIGSHSLTHPCLDRCTDAVLAEELTRSRALLGEMLGRAPDAVAYPNGNYDGRVVVAARDAGYRVGFLFDHRLGPLTPPDPMAVARVRVNSDTGMDRFATIVSGLHPAIHRARGRR